MFQPFPSRPFFFTRNHCLAIVVQLLYPTLQLMTLRELTNTLGKLIKTRRFDGIRPFNCPVVSKIR